MRTFLPSIFDAASPAALLGFLAVLVGASWPLFARRGAMLAGQASGTVLFAAHFALLGSTTGALTCLVALTQTAAAWRVRACRRRIAIDGACLVLLGVIAVETWRGWASLFAVAGTALATVGRLERAPQRMRWWFLAGTLTWLGHNALVGSPFGVASDALTIGATAVGAWRSARRPAAA
jgi:hypothetical protein